LLQHALLNLLVQLAFGQPAELKAICLDTVSTEAR